MQQLTIEFLMDIWDRTLGDTPTRHQFELWAVDNDPRVIKEAIVVTAKKNLGTNGGLSQDARIRFASGVINTKTARAAKYAADRETAQEKIAAQAMTEQKKEEVA